MITKKKNTPAFREDAEEEQRIPQAGDVLTEQDAYLLKNTRSRRVDRTRRLSFEKHP